MIISHEHHFIFQKVAKSAGSSMEFALSTVLEPRDEWSTPMSGDAGWTR